MDIIIKCIVVIFIVIMPYSSVAQSTNDADSSFEHILGDTGDVLRFALPASAVAASLFKKDYNGLKNYGLSLGTTLVLTFSLKAIIDKERPEEKHKKNSFPSGHSSAAFSGASFLQRRYGWKYGVPAYILAAITGISRVEGPTQKHDYWDVLGGAIIGIGSTYLFTKPYKKSNIKVGFKGNKDMKLLTIKWTF